MTRRRSPSLPDGRPMSSRRRTVDPAGRMVSVQVSVPASVRDQLRDLGEPLGLSLSSVGRFVLLAGLATARLELDEGAPDAS